MHRPRENKDEDCRCNYFAWRIKRAAQTTSTLQNWTPKNPAWQKSTYGKCNCKTHPEHNTTQAKFHPSKFKISEFRLGQTQLGRTRGCNIQPGILNPCKIQPAQNTTQSNKNPANFDLTKHSIKPNNQNWQYSLVMQYCQLQIWSLLCLAAFWGV